jgi:hypothetical protein
VYEIVYRGIAPLEKFPDGRVACQWTKGGRPRGRLGAPPGAPPGAVDLWAGITLVTPVLLRLGGVRRARLGRPCSKRGSRRRDLP